MHIFNAIKYLFLGHAFAPHVKMQNIPPYTHPPCILHDSCAPYLAREAKTRNAHVQLLTNETTCTGITWQHGPLRFARFLSDDEPHWRYQLPHPHFLFWQRISRTDIPEGWSASTLALHQSRVGMCIITPTGNPLAHISSHAKRHLKQWKKQPWIIETITMHEYWDVAFRSTLAPTHKKAFNILLAEKIAGHGNRIGIIGARPVNSPTYEAAFAYLDIPEIKTSLHHVSCITEMGKNVHAGTGLMAWWLTRLQNIGYHVADFGIFWTPGEPKTWKGFSDFKAQFCTNFFDFPHLLRKKW